MTDWQPQRGAWFVVLWMFAVGIVAGVWSDVFLWLGKEPTLTEFLRANPKWFIMPAVLMLALIAGLAAHLYLEPLFYD